MKILTLFLRHGTAKYPAAEREIEAFYQALPGVERRTIILDNALPSGCEPETRDGTTILPGDNTAWEFSAWDKGIRWVGEEIWLYDLVHLVTSAFNTLYTAYIPRITPSMLAWAAQGPVCLGHIDCFNEPVEVLTYRSQHWIRSCFLFLPPAELKAIGSLVTVHRGSGLFSGNPNSPFAVGARLSANYRDNIAGWLTGRDVGQGVLWHSAFQLNKETLCRFEEKALTILNEHLLSIRLRALGCATVDVTWLGGISEEKRHVAMNVGWRQQLRNRSADAIVLPGPAGPDLV